MQYFCTDRDFECIYHEFIALIRPRTVITTHPIMFENIAPSQLKIFEDAPSQQLSVLSESKSNLRERDLMRAVVINLRKSPK